MKTIQVAGAEPGFHVSATTPRSQAATMVLPPGDRTGGPDNRHDQADQWLYVVDGRAEVRIEGHRVALGSGEMLLIEAGETHEVRSTGDRPLVTLNFYSEPTF